MSEDYSKWPKEELFQHALCLMETVDNMLETIRIRCENKIARLKAADYLTLSDENRKLLDSQIAFEKEHGLCYLIPVSPVGKPVC